MTAPTVQQTLYFPLLGRARAAQQLPECFEDPWALQVASFVEKEGTQVTAMAGFPDMVYGLRHQVTVTEVRRYVAEHPGAAVVNIGCGLDSLAPDLAGLDCRIHNLDLPDVIELRQRWYAHNGHNPDVGAVSEQPEERDIACSVLDHGWMDRVDGSRGMIAVAAGVFYYFEVDDVRRLVDALAHRFPGGELCYDSESPAMMRGSERQIAKHGNSTVMPFKVKNPYAPRQWNGRVRAVEVEFDFSAFLAKDARARLPWKYRASFRMLAALKAMYEVRVVF